MKNRKKLLLLLSALLVFFILFFIIQIYAKYLSTASGNTEMSIARWNILVNNLSIKSNTDISSSIVPVFPGTENISSDIIAPTSEGYFDLNLDFSAVDVSFKYEITTSVDEQSPVQDLVTTGYSVDDGEKLNFENYNSPISETIPLGSEIKSRNIRIYVLWNDDENTATMNNTADTIATNSEAPAIFHVNISFTQIAN